MSEGLQDGAWIGKRVFILGGGPSLHGYHESVLAGEITLGLNMAFLHNPTANLIYDKRLLGRISFTEEWASYKGFKLWLNYEEKGFSDDPIFGATPLCEFVSNPYFKRWPTALADGIYRGNNAGSSGICLADILGADTIYLLGYDMSVDAGRPSNWHSAYPDEWQAKESNMRAYRKDIESISTLIRARVVNVTPGSSLLTFPMASLEGILKPAGVR
jgi:hypothetical protein